MNKEVKEKWIKALRSGRYRQTTGRLKDRDGRVASYCCLGVLCQVGVKDHVISPSKGDVDGDYVYGKYEKNDVLPIEIMEWGDLDTNDGKLKTPLKFFKMMDAPVYYPILLKDEPIPPYLQKYADWNQIVYYDTDRYWEMEDKNSEYVTWHVNTLIELNDELGFDFNQIAAVIEEQF